MFSTPLKRSYGIRQRLTQVALHESRTVATRAPHRLISSTRPAYTYVVVDHSEAYETAMQGPHGRQLALAKLEGAGKDDPPYDPFSEFEELSATDFEEDEEMEGSMIEAGDIEEEDDEEEDDEVEDEFEMESMYNPDGSLRRRKAVLATLRAGFPSGGQFAIFQLGGAQFKATTDDVIVANRLQPVEKYKIGSVHKLTDVMLVGSSHLTLVGVPFVTGAEVQVMVEEITRDSKVIVFKKRRRKNSQRKNGFRRDVTILRVLDIRMPEEYRNHKHIGREIVDSLDEHFEMLETSSDSTAESGDGAEKQKSSKMQSITAA